MRRRRDGGARWLGLVAVGTSLVAGCGSGPETARGGSSWEPVGSRPIGETVLPRIDEYRLVGIRYCGPGGLEGYLEMDLPLRGELGALAHLENALTSIEEWRRSEPGRRPWQAHPSHPSPFGTMTYELVVGKRWILDLLIEDAGSWVTLGKSWYNDYVMTPVLVTARGLDREVRIWADAPALAYFLRDAAWAALRRVAAPPRIPRTWHDAATAWFLIQRGWFRWMSGPDELEARWYGVLDGLRETPDPDAFVVAFLGLLGPGGGELGHRDAGWISELTGSGDISSKVLRLTIKAAWGDRAALDEILRLCVECPRRERLFAQSLAVLFPPHVNPDLRGRHPTPASSEAEASRFLDQICGGAPGATWKLGGWRLEE